MKKTNFYGFNDVTFLRKNKKKKPRARTNRYGPLAFLQTHDSPKPNKLN